MRKGRCLNIPTANDGQSASSTYLADHRVSAPLLSSSRIGSTPGEAITTRSIWTILSFHFPDNDDL